VDDHGTAVDLAPMRADRHVGTVARVLDQRDALLLAHLDAEHLGALHGLGKRLGELRNLRAQLL
jgi:hypothetical protein